MAVDELFEIEDVEHAAAPDISFRFGLRLEAETFPGGRAQSTLNLVHHLKVLDIASVVR